MKEKVIEYIYETYGVSPEYLWASNPNSAALRNKRTKKWFGVIIGNLSPEKLGIKRNGNIDVLNLKCDPLFMYSVVDNKGVFKGYHMNKKHWISVLLDGSVDFEDIEFLIQMSFSLINKSG